MPGARSGYALRFWRRVGAAALAALILGAAGGAPVDARRKVGAAEAKPLFVAPRDLFGMTATEHPPAKNFAKWTDVLARYETERRLERALCERGDCALVRWRRFLARLKRGDAMAQLRAVNAYLNRVAYKTDLDLYGTEDYWATPRELFANGGDCEDYAIAKYFSLRALGWPAERLRIVVVHDRARDLVHAALIAYHGGSAYLLDIEIGEVTEQVRIDRYVPIFAISENGWWSYGPGEHVVTKTEAAKPAKAEIAIKAVAKSVAKADTAGKHELSKRSALRAAMKLLQIPKPVVRTAQSEPDDDEDKENDNTPMIEPGERIEEVFLPAARSH